MKDFFKDHPFVAGIVTILSVWSITGTVRHVADVATKKDPPKPATSGGPPMHDMKHMTPRLKREQDDSSGHPQTIQSSIRARGGSTQSDSSDAVSDDF